jgi:hypothetical protein
MGKTIKYGVLVLAALFVAYPYYCAYRISEALKTQNIPVLEIYVDWPALRTSAKDQLKAVFSGGMANRNSSTDASGSALGAALTNVIIPKAVDWMVDNTLTPYGTSVLLRKRQIGNAVYSAEVGVELRNVRYAFFATPTVFQIELGEKGSSEDEWIGATLRLKDWVWQLSSVQILTRNNSPSAEEIQKLLDPDNELLKTAPTGSKHDNP